MKDTDIAVYKSFLLKLSYGAPGWPVSRFRPGTLVFILPDFGRDTDDLDLRHNLAAREHSLLAAFILVMLLDRALKNDGIALVNLRQGVRPGSRLPNEVMAFGIGKGVDRGKPLTKDLRVVDQPDVTSQPLQNAKDLLLLLAPPIIQAWTLKLDKNDMGSRQNTDSVRHAPTSGAYPLPSHAPEALDLSADIPFNC